MRQVSRTLTWVYNLRKSMKNRRLLERARLRKLTQSNDLTVHTRATLTGLIIRVCYWSQVLLETTPHHCNLATTSCDEAPPITYTCHAPNIQKNSNIRGIIIQTSGHGYVHSSTTRRSFIEVEHKQKRGRDFMRETDPKIL